MLTILISTRAVSLIQARDLERGPRPKAEVARAVVEGLKYIILHVHARRGKMRGSCPRPRMVVHGMAWR